MLGEIVRESRKKVETRQPPVFDLQGGFPVYARHERGCEGSLEHHLAGEGTVLVAGFHAKDLGRILH